jgi:methionyl-tRNA formyltransferase
MLKKTDGLLDFSQPAVELERRVRAMQPWPGAWFEWDGRPLKVARASVGNVQDRQLFKRFVLDGNPAIQTPAGALVLDEVQPSGKRNMPGSSFLAGARGWSSIT